MNQSNTRRLRLSVAAIGLIMGLVGGVVGMASASHIFGDVPDSHAFHGEIGALYDAGVATGFTGSNCNGVPGGSPCYKPADPITRGQMAFQLTQGLGRINSDDQTTNAPNDGDNVVAEAAMTGAGAAGSVGYVRIDANASVTGLAAECDCRLTIEIRDVNSNTTINTQTVTADSAESCVITTICMSASTFAVRTLAGHVSNSYQARARLSTDGTNAAFSVVSHVVVQYIPFDNNPTT
jgi:hypothetical protein